MATAPENPVRHTFKASRRLRHAREFARVFAGKVKKVEGPLVVFAVPNGLPHHRLGLSIGRRVGGAVRRSLLKRHLREAFRLCQHEFPMRHDGGYDVIVGSNAHEPLNAETYQAALIGMIRQAHRVWEKRLLPPSGETIDV